MNIKRMLLVSGLCAMSFMAHGEGMWSRITSFFRPTPFSGMTIQEVNKIQADLKRDLQSKSYLARIIAKDRDYNGLIKNQQKNTARKPVVNTELADMFAKCLNNGRTQKECINEIDEQHRYKFGLGKEQKEAFYTTFLKGFCPTIMQWFKVKTQREQEEALLNEELQKVTQQVTMHQKETAEKSNEFSSSLAKILGSDRFSLSKSIIQTPKIKTSLRDEKRLEI